MSNNDTTDTAPAERPLHLPTPDARPTLITGGAGFIGAHLAYRLLSAGEPVILLDNLSRPGATQNLARLKKRHEGMITLKIADVRDAFAVRQAVRCASFVFHLATPTTALMGHGKSQIDFDVDVSGTLNVLDAIHGADRPPPLLFASSSEVYGTLDDILLTPREMRSEPLDPVLRATGISESRPLDPQIRSSSSKGLCEHHVLSFARAHDLCAFVFRLSCVYGPHQLSDEGFGWVSHCLRRVALGGPVAVHGDGHATIDALAIDDLVDAFILARRDAKRLAGAVYNIGGGPANALSQLELIQMVEEIDGKRPELAWCDPLPGVPRYYVSDIQSFSRLTSWAPRTPYYEGIRRLYAFIRSSERGLESSRIVPAAAS